MFKPSLLFVLSLSATLQMTGVGMIVALLPQHVHAMTGTLESVGLIASIFALAYLFAQLLVGVLSDRLGAKRFLVAGYLLCCLSGFVFYLADAPAGLYLGRVLQGLGEAPIWALGPAMLSLAYPTAKGRVIGIYNAAIHIGLTLGPLLGLLIAAGNQGQLPFLVFAALCFAAGCIVQVFLKDARVSTAGTKPDLRQFLAVLRAGRPVTLLTGVLFYGAGYGIFVSVLPISLTQTHGFDRWAVSALFVLFCATISLSQIVAGPLSDRSGGGRFPAWGMALAAVGMGGFHFMPGTWALVPLGLAGLGLGVFCVVSIAELNECVPDTLKGAISGSYYFFWGAGYVLGPMTIGAVADHAPLPGFAVLATLFALQSLALGLWGRFRT